MIPADSSIDDEVSLFPVNLNGKKDNEDTNKPMTCASAKQLVLSISLKNATTSTGIRRSQDPGISQTKVSGACSSDVLGGLGQDHNKGDKRNTSRTKRGQPRCVSAVSVIRFYVITQVSLGKVIHRTPAYSFSGGDW